jgi:hypothetical protein
MTVALRVGPPTVPAVRATFRGRKPGNLKSIESADGSLRRAVLARLISDPLINAGHIGAAASAGVVTLSGYVTSYRQKDAASAATRCVKGVERVADEVRVAVPCTPLVDLAPELMQVWSPTVALRPVEVSATPHPTRHG